MLIVYKNKTQKNYVIYVLRKCIFIHRKYSSTQKKKGTPFFLTYSQNMAEEYVEQKLSLPFLRRNSFDLLFSCVDCIIFFFFNVL